MNLRMFFKKKEEVIPPPTTEELIHNALTSVQDDVTYLTVKRNNSLNIFHKTAEELKSVNEELAKQTDTLSNIINFATATKDKIEAQFQENEKVRKNILDIIGDYITD